MSLVHVLNDDKSTEIRYIYHLSDIHIRNNQRHEEYKEVFEKVYKLINNDIGSRRNESVIVITGDIMHSKTELSPESIKFVWYFFKNLSKIAPLIVICGNHDCNMSNSGRLDALSPIVEDIGKLKNFHYLKTTGYYQYHNIMFSLTSIFDKIIINPPDKKIMKTISQNNKYSIALYHGQVYCPQTNLGESVSKSDKLMYDVFQGFDRALLGDFHRHHYLDKEKHMAYSGSLIQQSFGEPINDHGILKWDLFNDKSKLIEVKNNYGFHTLNVCDGEIENVVLSKKPYIRLRVSNTNTVRYKEIIQELESKYDVQGIIKDSVLVNVAVKNTKKKTINHNERMSNYLKNKGISDKKSEQIINLHKQIYRNVDDIEEKNRRWSILELKFSNMLSYGENNVIDFTTYEINQTIGIVAPNHYGKSAILDIILFCLFDKFSRSKTVRDILNKNKKEMSCSLLIKVDNKKYLIERSGKRTKWGEGQKLETTVDFFSIDDKKKNLNGDTKLKTNKLIVDLIGNYDDYLATCFCLQGRNASFLDMTQLERKEYLSSILKLNNFNDCYKIAHDKLKGLQGELSVLEKIVGQKSLDEIKDNIKKINKNIKNITKNKELLSHKYESTQFLIDTSNYDIMKYAELNKFKLQSRQDFDELRERLIIINPIDPVSNDKLSEKEEQLIIVNKQLIDFRKMNDIKSKRNEIDLLYRKVINCDMKDINVDELIFEKDELIKKLTILNSHITDDSDVDDLIMNIQMLKSELKIIDHNKISMRDHIMNEIDEVEFKIQDYVDKFSGMKLYSLDECNVRIEEKDNVINMMNDIDKLTNEVDVKDYCDKIIVEYEDNINVFKNIKNNNIINVNEYLNKKKNLQYLLNESHENEINCINNIKIQKKIDKLDKMITENKDMKNKIKERDLIVREMKIINEKIDYYHACIKQNNINKNVNENINILKEEILDLQNKEDVIINIREKLLEEIDEFKKAIVKRDEIYKKCEENKRLIRILNEYEIMWNDWKNRKDINIERIKYVDNLSEEINDLKKQKIKLDTELEIAKRDIVSHMEERKKYDDKADEVDIYQLYCQMTHQQGLPDIILREHLPKIEQDVNEILRPMVNFNIEFIFTDMEKIKNSIDINLVRSKCEPYSVQLASGFEKFIVGLAIRMTLSQISLTAKPNFLIIDEGWNCLDSENLNNVNQIMQYIKTQYEFVIIISHLDQLKDQCDYIINIDKKDGYSRITI